MPLLQRKLTTDNSNEVYSGNSMIGKFILKNEVNIEVNRSSFDGGNVSIMRSTVSAAKSTPSLSDTVKTTEETRQVSQEVFF